MAYATLSELRSWLAIDDTLDDSTLSLALDVASQKVDDFCGRTFAVPTGVSVRTFRSSSSLLLTLDPGCDIASTTGLVVRTDDNEDGTFETTWTIDTDFVLEHQQGDNGATTWPSWQIVAVGNRYWPTRTLRRTVQVTARWGWQAVPAPVKQATLLLAGEAFKAKDAPFGVAAFGEFGPLRVRDNPMVAQLLRLYRHPVTAAVIA